MSHPSPEPAIERGVAQTNLRLYRELIGLGWNAEDLSRTRAAYGLAAELFCARFRANGKPFVCHLVGTAGLLARLGSRPALLQAGLLHAAYAQGDFGTARRGPTRAARTRVRADVGSEVEALVHAFTVTPWKPRRLLERIAAGEELEALERDVALLRLANELEECLDLGRRFSGKDDRLEDGEVLSRLARALGREELAAAIERALAEHRAAVVPDELRRTTTRSFARPPRSAWRRPRVAVGRIVDRVVRLGRRLAGRGGS